MHPVFISYARDASAKSATALRDALPDECFLDDPEIEVGDTFPERIIDALLASRVAVLFASERYFQRRYCLWELLAILGPYLAEPEAGNLEHVVVVLDGQRPDALPPAIQRTNWPMAANVDDAVRVMRERLSTLKSTLGERYAAAGQPPSEVRAKLLELTDRPPPAELSQVKVHYGLAPVSLQDDFVGRWDDLHRVDFWLRTLRGEPGTAAPIVTVEGLGGLGKSRLMAEYAHRFGPRHFSGGLIWIDAGKALEPQFHGVLQAFDSNVPDLPEFQQQKRDVRAELATCLRSRSSVLWMVDDVPEPDAGKAPAPLTTYCPALGQVATVMTSRRRLSFEPGRRGILLHGLETDAAIRLLKREIASDGQLTFEQWKEIVDWVGALPLALTLLNQVLLSGETPGHLLEASRSQGGTATLDQHLEALRGEVEEGSLRGVTEAFLISYEKLYPQTRDAARLLAQLAPASIPAAILDERVDVFTTQVKAQLRRRSFVSEQGQMGTAQGIPIFGTMHRLLADFLRDREPNPPVDWSAACRAVIGLLVRAGSAKDQWRLLELVAPHARHLLSLRPPPGPDTDPLTASLHLVLSSALLELGRVEEALGESEAAVEEFGRLAGAGPEQAPLLSAALNDHSNRLILLGRRAEALRTVRKAVELLRQLVAAAPEVYDVFFATALINLSRCLNETEGGDDALRIAEESVEVCRRIAGRSPGSRIPELAIALGTLARRLCERGAATSALPMIEEAVSIARALAAERPAVFQPILARALSEHGMVLRLLGRSSDSESSLRESVALFRGLASERSAVFDRELASTLMMLSDSLIALGQGRDAVEAAQEAVQILKPRARALPEMYAKDLAVAFGNLASLAEKLGAKEAAVVYSRTAASVFSQLAEADPETFQAALMKALSDLADRLAALGSLEAAMKASEQALAILARLPAVGAEALEFERARLMNNHAHRLLNLGKPTEALGFAEDGVARFRRGARAAALSSALENLAAILSALGRREDAETARKEAASLR